MNAQDRALARDLIARARLAADPVYQTKQRRQKPQQMHPSSRLGPPPAQQARQPTGHQLMMLRYLSRGLTIPMVADAMGIGVDSVNTGLAAARKWLRAKNSTQAVAEAIRRGLIP